MGVARKPAASRAAPRGDCHTDAPFGAFDVEPAEPTIADGERERFDRNAHEVVGRGVCCQRGERQQRLAATLDVDREVAVDQDDECAGFAAGPMAFAASGRFAASFRAPELPIVASDDTGAAGQASAAP